MAKKKTKETKTVALITEEVKEVGGVEEPLLTSLEASEEVIELKEVKEVCKRAYIDEYIESLPKKYNTIIGEGGINLSGAQKQRLAIARTLLLNTKIRETTKRY